MGRGAGATRGRRAGLAATTILLVAVAVTSCSRSGVGSSSAAPTGTIRAVAAENFYGDIVSQIGGPHVSVTSIITDPNADPHLFEPGTATGAAVAGAQLVIENGLGYDSFMDKLLAASPNPDRKVVTVSEVLQITADGANPHLWYDLPRIPEIANAIAAGLTSVDPSNRAYYQSHLASFDASLKPLDDALAQIKASDAGAPVAYTEPVPGYLLEAAGLSVKTPESFALAIEDGSEPTPQAVASMESLIMGNQIRVFLYNSQATSPITEHLLGLAQQNNIPVVPVSETLPPGKSFQDWQLGQIQALGAALAG